MKSCYANMCWLLMFVSCSFSGFIPRILAQTPKNFLAASSQSSPLPALKIDSLQQIVQKYSSGNVPDSLRVLALIDLARELWATAPKDARRYAFEALGIAERADFKRGIANSLNTIGVAYFYQGWYDIALEYYQKSLILRREIQDSRGVGSSLNNIGLIYSTQKKFDDALKYLYQALSVYQRIPAKSSMAAAYNNIGIVYRNKKMYDSAQAMHQAALRVLDGSNNSNGFALTYTSLGTLLQETGEQGRALEYHKQAIALYEKNDNRKGLVDAHFGAAKALFALKKNDEALRSLDVAMVLAQGLNARKELRDCYELLAHIEERIGNFSGAYYNVRRYEALKDSLFSEEADTKSAEFNAKYDAELRAKEIALLTSEKDRQSLLRNSLIIMMLLGLIGIVLLANRFRLKKRSEAALQAANGQLSAKNELIEQLLENVLPAPIARRMQAGEQRIAERFSEVTVLFADIVGFTRLASQISPEELVTLLDAVFSDFDALAERNGLEKIKTIGDAYLAVAGVPEPCADHAERVARFALDIQRIMGNYSIDAPSGEILPVRVRIGIHTGAVVAGVIGKKKFSFDLWGETVNIASRLQSHAEAGEIQCSQVSYEMLHKKCIFEERGELHLKGNLRTRAYLLKEMASASEEPS